MTLTLQANQEWILKSFDSAIAGSDNPLWLKGAGTAADGRNEAIVFIKPELTVLGKDRLPAFLKIFDEALSRFGVEILDIGCLSGTYMGKHKIILDHYGVMTDASFKGWAGINEDSRKKITELFGVPAESVFGGHEFLDKFPAFNTESLNVLWDTIIDRNERVAPGTYAAKLQYGNDPIVVINGSHPGTVDHYCGKDRLIIAMVVRSTTEWAKLRDEMVGVTKVQNALPTSIRGQLLARKDELGIPVVTPRYNGIHMSAGPLEGMVELIRFTSNPATNTKLTPEQTNFGAAWLAAGGSASELQTLMTNPLVNAGGKTQSAFDATELMDTADAITTLKTALKQAA